VQSLGFRVQGAGYRVQGAGYRVQGSGFRVQGAGTTCGCRSGDSPPSEGRIGREYLLMVYDSGFEV
jgi:hypothetical protein